MPAPNRLATYFVAAAALCAALAPAIANLDITSTVGIVGGVGALAGIVAVWLRGWQSYEARQPLVPIEPPLNVKPPSMGKNPVGDPSATGSQGTTLRQTPPS